MDITINKKFRHIYDGRVGEYIYNVFITPKRHEENINGGHIRRISIWTLYGDKMLLRHDNGEWKVKPVNDEVSEAAKEVIKYIDEMLDKEEV